MPFDSIRRFVETETVGGGARVTGILHRLRVYDNQGRPLTFFFA